MASAEESPPPRAMESVKEYELQIVHNSLKVEAKTVAGTNITMDQIHPVLELIKKRYSSSVAPKKVEIDIPIQLINALKEIIGELSFLEADPCIYGNILNNFKFHFQNDVGLIEKFGEPASDIENLVQYKPTEVIGDKCCQIFCSLCIGNVEDSLKELRNLKTLLDNELMALHSSMEDGFQFIGKVLELFVRMMSGLGSTNVVFTDQEHNKNRPSFKNLSSAAKIAVKAVKTHFFRQFRFNASIRAALLKEMVDEDSSNPEWLITLADAARRRRRDNPSLRNRRPDDEEFRYIDRAYKLEPENPFVILCLMDCIVDCLRTRCSFECCGTTYLFSHDTVAFMKNTCRKLLKDFPRSVRIWSQVSDYFARFVPLRYFDIPFAGECLDHALSINPEYPKTLHRLGIYYRMSRGALTTSFKWFQKAAETDPGHFNALMECVKNMLGRTKEYDVVEYIHKKLLTPEASYFTEFEILEILFYEGLAYFIQGKYESALDMFGVVVAKEQDFFRLENLDQLGGYFNWDVNLISTDKLRLWINEEKERNDALRAAGDGDGSHADIIARSKLIHLLYNLMIGYEEPYRSRSSGSLKTSPTYTGYVLVRGLSKEIGSISFQNKIIQ